MSDLREYLRANLFDGDEGGVLTARIATHLDELVEVITEWERRSVPDDALRARLATLELAVLDACNREFPATRRAMVHRIFAETAALGSAPGAAPRRRGGSNA